MKNKKRGLLIFDFDGTIADTKALYYKVIYNQLKFFGFSYKQVDRAIDLGLSLRKTLRKLGLSFLSSWFLEKKVLKNIKKHIDKIKKCRDVEHIKQIRAEKILISNSSKQFVLPVLKHLRLKQEFKEIYGADDFSDKAEFIAQYIKKRKLNKKNVYYIGDRAADVILAKKAKIKSIIISGTCAWDSKSEIIKQKPDFIIQSLENLKKIL